MATRDGSRLGEGWGNRSRAISPQNVRENVTGQFPFSVNRFETKTHIPPTNRVKGHSPRPSRLGSTNISTRREETHTGLEAEVCVCVCVKNLGSAPSPVCVCLDSDSLYPGAQTNADECREQPSSGLDLATTSTVSADEPWKKRFREHPGETLPPPPQPPQTNLERLGSRATFG